MKVVNSFKFHTFIRERVSGQSKKDIISFFSAFLALALCCTPFADYSFVHWIELLGLSVWLFLNLDKLVGNLKYRPWLLLFAYWIIFSTIVFCVTNNLRYLKIFSFDFLLLLFPFLVFISSDSRQKENYCYLLFAIAFLSNLFLLISHLALTQLGNSRGQVSYSIVYGSLFLCDYLLYLLLRVKNGSKKIVLFFLWLFFVVVLVLGSYTIALLTWAVSTLLLFCFFISNKKSVKITLLAIMLGLAIVLLCLPESASKFLVSLIPNDTYQQRIADLFYFIHGDYSSIGIALNNRIEIYSVSISSIKSHPILGNVWFISDLTPKFWTISLHSTLLDFLALFGCLFGFLPIFLYVSPLFYVFGSSKKKLPFLLILGLSFLFVLSLDNPVPFLGVMLLLIIPTCLGKEIDVESYQVSL